MSRLVSSSFDLPKNAQLCILRLSAIGDVCHAVSMVSRIRQERPDIGITWVIGSIEHRLVEDMQGVEFVVYHKQEGKAARKNVKLALQGRTFDALCIMQVAFRANWLSRVIHAKVRLGFDRKHAKEGHSLFINKRIQPQSQPHVLQGFHAFADALGIPNKAPLCWAMPYTIDEEAFAKKAFANFGKTVIICPAASKPERCWSATRYAEIAKYCQSLGFTVVLCGGPGALDKQLEQQIQAELTTSLPSFIGSTTLKQLFCLLQLAEFVIAPDTGPAHMATAAGTPVIGLYAHSNPRRTGPYLSLEYVVSVYDKHIEAQTGKPWTQLKWGTRAKGKHLMDDISVHSVSTVITRLVGKM